MTASDSHILEFPVPSLTTPAIASPYIVVVRHGETDWNAERRIQGRTEVPLNAVGRDQAVQTAEALRVAGNWQRVITSSLGRAHETGAIIAQALGIALHHVDDSILERDFGPAEGLPVEDVRLRWPNFEVPDSESLDALERRGASAFERLLIEQPGSIVVSHGALMRSGLARLTGQAIPRILNGEPWVIARSTSGAVVVSRLEKLAAVHQPG